MIILTTLSIMLIFAGAIQRVNIRGNPISVSIEGTGNDWLGQKARVFEKEEVIELLLRDHDHFWQGSPTNIERIGQKSQKLPSNYLSFKGEHYDSDQPPHRLFKYNVSCKQLENLSTTLLSRRKSGAISLVGKVGQVSPPHIVLP